MVFCVFCKTCLSVGSSCAFLVEVDGAYTDEAGEDVDLEADLCWEA